MKFLKYQSLGNDFILIDAIAEPSIRSAFTKIKIQSMCHRHFGIGADGILVIYRLTTNDPVQCEILNSDGSIAELCINGIRCIAHYLFTYHHFPAQFPLKMDKRTIDCYITKNADNDIHITLNTGKAESYHEQTIILPGEKSIAGAAIKFSNPHFIIFKTPNEAILLNEGKVISTHAGFSHQTNVAYVTQEKENTYRASFYERGAGITLSCGSGASAIMWALYQQKKINAESSITLHMSGGAMQCYIDKDHNIIQKANAKLVYQGQK